LAAAFASEYGALHAATISPGRFHLSRHESSLLSHGLLKGELVIAGFSPLGFPWYWAETSVGSGTFGDFGFLRYEGSAWKLYELGDKSAEVRMGDQIQTDGDTIAWFRKESNLEEFTVWQRITGKQPSDEDIMRELGQMKTLADEVIARRAERK
jgi:hypothetical protein